jgi:hypothetical protein
MFFATGASGKGRYSSNKSNPAEAKLPLDLGRRDIYGWRSIQFASNGYFIVHHRKETTPPAPGSCGFRSSRAIRCAPIPSPNTSS